MTSPRLIPIRTSIRRSSRRCVRPWRAAGRRRTHGINATDSATGRRLSFESTVGAWQSRLEPFLATCGGDDGRRLLPIGACCRLQRLGRMRRHVRARPSSGTVRAEIASTTVVFSTDGRRPVAEFVALSMPWMRVACSRHGRRNAGPPRIAVSRSDRDQPGDVIIEGEDRHGGQRPLPRASALAEPGGVLFPARHTTTSKPRSHRLRLLANGRLRTSPIVRIYRL